MVCRAVRRGRLARLRPLLPLVHRALRLRGLRPPCERCRPTAGRPVAVIEHPAGEETQWDWVELPDPPAGWDGYGKKAFLLVGALAHSSKWRGELCESMDQPQLAHAQHLIAAKLGGITKDWRFDRMATVVHPGTGKVTATYAVIAKHFGVRVRPCPPRRGNRKGVVEKGQPQRGATLVTHPSQVCFEWNTARHTQTNEQDPRKRAFTLAELQAFFDRADDEVAQPRRLGRKGELAAFRDAVISKTAYAYGLRRNEVRHLQPVDFDRSPHARAFQRFGVVNVRWGKSTTGSAPKRRRVLTVFSPDGRIGVGKLIEHVVGDDQVLQAIWALTPYDRVCPARQLSISKIAIQPPASCA